MHGPLSSKTLERRRWHWHGAIASSASRASTSTSSVAHPWYRAGFPVNLITRYRTADGSGRAAGKLGSPLSPRSRLQLGSAIE